MQTTTWTTPRGKKVEMTWTIDTTKTVDADGHKFEAEIPEHKREPRITSVTIGSHQFRAADRRLYKGQSALYLGEVGGKPAFVGLPNEVEELVWGEYDRRREDQIRASIEAENKYQEHVARIKRAMDE